MTEREQKTQSAYLSERGQDSEPLIVYFDTDTVWNFNSNGLFVYISPLHTQKEFVINGQTTVIPAGTRWGKLDFTPLEDLDTAIGVYDGSATSYALAKGIRGFDIFFTTIDNTITPGERAVLLPAYLYGITDRRMANFVSRFGFSIIDAPESQEYVEVLGETYAVRAKFEARKQAGYKGKPLEERLMERADRNMKSQ